MVMAWAGKMGRVRPARQDDLGAGRGCDPTGTGSAGQWGRRFTCLPF